jgi:hypothetical protein
MTYVTLAGADRAAPITTTAAELAARIPVPQRLPERYDGERLKHLSPSSYSLWVACPEAWRRRYIKGQKPAPSGPMFIGSRIDDDFCAYHRRILEHGDRLALDLYRDQWHSELETERTNRGSTGTKTYRNGPRSTSAGRPSSSQSRSWSRTSATRSTSSADSSSRWRRALNGRSCATWTSRR